MNEIIYFCLAYVLFTEESLIMASKKNKGLVYSCTTCQYLGIRKDAINHFLCKHVVCPIDAPCVASGL